jgi:hypothetical protein
MHRIRFQVRYRRHSIVLLILIMVLPITSTVLALAVRQSSAESAQRPLLQRAAPSMRRFYVTKNLVSADQAPTTCAAGYHFASLWEIADPSNLEYDTALGVTSPDSGKGPPTAVPFFSGALTIRGWVRTGFVNSTSAIAGNANCSGWSSTNDTHSGTTIGLPSTWTDSPDIGVWNATTRFCDSLQRVWCVQDELSRVFLPLVLRE